MQLPMSRTMILITGGAGFIGSHFVRYILKKRGSVEVINFDKLTYAGNSDNLRDFSTNPRYKFHRGDISDTKAVGNVFSRYRPQYLVNFAAETHVDRSIHQGAGEFIATNVEGTRNLLEAARHFGIKRFLQVSTDEVYGSLELNSRSRFREKSLLCPNSPYAASKAAGDLLCHSYFSTWRVPVVVSRSSNNYGSHQYPEKLIPFFVTRMISGKTLPLYGDGKNMRDWLYVIDNCRALELCLFEGTPGEIYNIGAQNEKSNLEVARAILKHFGRDDSRIEFVKDRPGHDRKYAVDASKIQKELGWRPRHEWDKVFPATIEWYIKSQKWLKRAQERKKELNPHIV